MGTLTATSVEGEKIVENVTDTSSFSASNVQSKLHHSIRLCSAAAKKAKVFELQRSIKKLKAAASVDEQDALKQEVAALKSLETASVAALALKAKLTKCGLLPKGNTGMDDDELKTKFPLAPLATELFSMIQDEQKASSALEEKARSKLSSNKLLAEEASKAVSKIEALVRNRSMSAAKKGEQRKEPATGKARAENSKRVSIVQDSTGESGIDDESLSLDIEPDDASADERDEEGSQKAVEAASKSSALKRKQRPSLVEDDELPRKTPKAGQASKGQFKEETVSTSGSDTDHDEDEDELEEEERQGLPALSTGFVAGRGFNLGRGSDDEWSDGDADGDSIDEDVDKREGRKEGRKNRMGQRARRAIWEKKFGKGANHLKLLEKEPKRAPRTFTDRQGNVVKLPPSDRGWGGALAKEAPRVRPPPSRPSIAKAPATEAEMHPSWVAKQQQKARQEAAMGATKVAAKKIVFD